jgi:CcmD family protein
MRISRFLTVPVMRRPAPRGRASVALVCGALLTVTGGVDASPAGVSAVVAGVTPGAFVIAMQQPPPATDDFVPVGDLPAQEQLPAAPLLIAAYAFVWAALLIYLLMLWRRLARVERELGALSRQVDDRRRS